VDDDPVSSLIETSRALERSGNIGAAFTSAEQALETARVSHLAGSLVKAQVRVAFLHFRLGHYDQARAIAADALAQDGSDPFSQVDVWLVLGNCAAETDDLAAAEDSFLRAIDLSRQMDYPLALMRGLHNLATGVYLPRGQFELALAADQEVVHLATKNNVPKLYWGALVTIAWIYWLTGKVEPLAASLDELFRHATPGSLEEGYGLWLSGNLAQKNDASDQALALYGRARSIAEAIGEPGLGILVRLGPSRYHRECGDPATACQWADDALTMTLRAGYRHLQGLALIERGRSAWALGDLSAAGADLRAAIELLQRLDLQYDLARASLLLAALLSTEKQPEAADYWQRAARLIQKQGYDFLLDEERSLVLPWVASGLDSSDLDQRKTSQELFDRLQRTPPAPLQIDSFGQFSVRVGSHLVSTGALRQRRSGEVLAYLAASPGQTLTAHQIADALCPDKGPNAAVVFYHHAVSALRRMLEPDLPDRRFPSRYLDVSEERVTLILPPGSRIDFLAFQKHAQQRQWEQALALYHGEFLPMLRYAEWTVDLRQHLADQFEQALLGRAAECLAAGDAAACLELARKALRQNSWQEQAVELGMRAAIATGDRVTALKMYHRLEKDLERELGIEPQRELQQLYQAMKRP
jgi:DNA-binding SARP family transcriptional activator